MQPVPVTTFKPLTTPIEFTFFGVNMVASSAGLRGVSWWNKNYFKSCYSSFINNILPQLVKRPIVSFTSLFFAARFFVKRLPDSLQILKCQCRISLFCLSYKFFSDIVVQPRLKAMFSTREPSKQAFSRLSAFALKKNREKFCRKKGNGDVLLVASAPQTMPSLSSPKAERCLTF